MTFLPWQVNDEKFATKNSQIFNNFHQFRDPSFSTYAKFSEKLAFRTYPLIRTRTCAYQGVSNASSLKNVV